LRCADCPVPPGIICPSGDAGRLTHLCALAAEGGPVLQDLILRRAGLYPLPPPPEPELPRVTGRLPPLGEWDYVTTESLTA
jgi:hypothetical protein